MATDYPVTFDITRPEKFERPHVFLRVLLYWLIGWILGLAYYVLPVLSAIFISQKGSEKFIQEDAPRISGWLRLLMAAYAYLFLATDRLPTEDPEQTVRFQVQPAGTPTIGSALLRLIFSIPSAFVLGLLGIVAVVLWLVAAVYVLMQETYPQGIYDFIRGYLRWQARLLGYHASLVDEYPPFALDTGPEPAPAA